MLLNVLSDEFSVVQVSSMEKIDFSIDPLFIGKTEEEISVVLPTNCVSFETIAREDHWKMFKIEGILDFSLVGILAKISTLLAESDISIFAVSTFNTDYILVKTADFEEAEKVLKANGYQIN
ncbi:ACT domain-containing protein [Enterococcus olivae]